MKLKRRRYREKNPSIFIASTHPGNRIHDYLKGWGTVSKDGSVLWDYWRPITKRERQRREAYRVKHPPFSKFIFPIIKNMAPLASIRDLFAST